MIVSSLNSDLSEVNNILGDFNGYDDAPLVSRILSLESVVGSMENYDDTTLVSRINELESAMGSLSNYDDEPVITRISALEVALGDLNNQGDQYLSARLTNLENNFNIALDQLYQACVEKDSEPSEKTIPAIVEAVQNIDNGVYIDGVEFDKGVVSTDGSGLLFNNQNKLTGIINNSTDPDHPIVYIIPQYINNDKVVLE